MNFWKRFRQDWNIRVYMFLLAILLWVVVMMTQEYETTVNVPVVPVNIRADKILTNDLPDVVPVRFSGQGKDLFLLSYFRPARIELDLQAVDNTYAYPLNTELVEVPSGISVVPLLLPGQDTAYVQLEDRISRMIDVYPNVEVKTQSGYIADRESVRTVPDSVRVSGPESIVRRIDEVSTEERVYVGLTSSVEELIPLVAGSRVRLSPSAVRVTIPVDKLAEKTLRRVPVRVRGSIRGRTVILEPSVIDMRIKGPARKIAPIESDSVRVYIDLFRWERGKQEYTPIVELPTDVNLMDTTPDQVIVRLEVEE